MKLLFWMSAGLVLYTYFGYPVLVHLLATIRRRPIRRGPCQPRVSFVIPAYNESVVIDSKLRNTLSLRYPRERLDIIVASDGSTDTTNDLVRAYAGEGVRLVDSQPRRGKNGMLNQVVPALDGEVIVISDANIELAEDALERLMQVFADPEVGGAWGNKIYRNSARSSAGEGESTFLKYEKSLRSRESVMGSIVAGECSCLAFRREMFRPVPIDVPDDFALSTNVVAHGKRMVYVEDARAFEETAPTNRDEFRRKTRIIERSIRGFFKVLPLANPLRTGFYAVSLVTCQFLRRVVALSFVTMAVTLPFLAAQSATYAVLAAGSTALLLLAAGGALARGPLRQSPILFLPYFLVLVNVAVLVGFGRVVFGHRSVTWQPTERSTTLG